MPLLRRGGPGLIGGMARTAVVAGTASAVSGRVQRRQQQRWAEQDQAAYDQQAYAQQAAPAQPDYTAQLQELAALRDQGVITPEDFEAKKKQILGI